MMGYKKLIVVFLAASILKLSESCSKINWEEWSMEKILTNADIVLYGQENGRTNITENGIVINQDAEFQVYCIMKYDKSDPIKSPDTINETIIFPGVFEQEKNSCSGTSISVGKDVILATTRKADGTFKWHEMNSPDGAAFEANKDNLAAVAAMPCLDAFLAPAGVSNTKCPVKKSTVMSQDLTCGASGPLVSYLIVSVMFLINFVKLN